MINIKKNPALLPLFSFALLMVMWFLLAWIFFLIAPIVTDTQGVRYTVLNGASLKSVTRDLYEANIIKHPWFFDALVTLKGNKHELKAGEYLFPKGTTPGSLLRQITTGTGLVHYDFTIIAGWNFKQVREALLRNEAVNHDSTALSDAEIMAKLGQPQVQPEGQFFPDTYYFTKGYSDVALLKRAYQRMQTKLTTAWAQREPGLPYKNPMDALNAASLVEKEAAVEKDRPLIAGVILNRLRKNMPLQLDPTVIYAAGDKYDGKIHRHDLQSKNPYNTYTHQGLPPAPIAMPGMESLQAVLHPQHHDFLYFVAKDDGKREHQFSKTLVEHDKAVTQARQNQLHQDFFNSLLIRFYFTKLSFSQLHPQ